MHEGILSLVGGSMCRCHIACRAAFWPSTVGIKDIDTSLAGLNLFLSVANNTTIFAKVKRRHVCFSETPL